jgi:hypothetical protein
MGKVFICYRREDSADVTGRMRDHLVKRFGKDNVFTDVDSIPLGVDFRTHLTDGVQRCEILLAVIGKHWLEVGSERGTRRLDDDSDFVRIEIEAALRRDIPVIPVLVQGAPMPSQDNLPPTLKALAFRNGTQVRPDPDFGRDVKRLITRMDAIFQEHPRPVAETKVDDERRQQEIKAVETAAKREEEHRRYEEQQQKREDEERRQREVFEKREEESRQRQEVEARERQAVLKRVEGPQHQAEEERQNGLAAAKLGEERGQREEEDRQKGKQIAKPISWRKALLLFILSWSLALIGSPLLVPLLRHALWPPPPESTSNSISPEQLPDSKKEFNHRRLQELTAYQEYEKSLDQIGDPKDARSQAQLKQIKAKLIQLTPPEEDVWHQSEASQRRDNWIQDCQDIEDAIARLKNQYEDLIQKALGVLDHRNEPNLPKRAKEVLDFARSYPDPERDKNRPVKESARATYGVVFGIDSVEKIYLQWKKTREELEPFARIRTEPEEEMESRLEKVSCPKGGLGETCAKT